MWFTTQKKNHLLSTYEPLDSMEPYFDMFKDETVGHLQLKHNEPNI